MQKKGPINRNSSTKQPLGTLYLHINRQSEFIRFVAAVQQCFPKADIEWYG